MSDFIFIFSRDTGALHSIGEDLLDLRPAGQEVFGKLKRSALLIRIAKELHGKYKSLEEYESGVWLVPYRKKVLEIPVVWNRIGAAFDMVKVKL